MSGPGDQCLRDVHGFCLVAMLGHRPCLRAAGSGRCSVTDGQAAYDRAYDTAITRIYRAWRRRQQEVLS